MVLRQRLLLLWDDSLKIGGIEATHRLVEEIYKFAHDKKAIHELCDWGYLQLSENRNLAHAIVELGSFEHQSLIITAIHGICRGIKKSENGRHLEDLCKDEILQEAISVDRLDSSKIRNLVNRLNQAQESSVYSFATKYLGWNTQKTVNTTLRGESWLDMNCLSISWEMKDPSGETLLYELQYESVEHWMMGLENGDPMVILTSRNNSRLSVAFLTHEDLEQFVALLVERCRSLRKVSSKSAQFIQLEATDRRTKSPKAHMTMPLLLETAQGEASAIPPKDLPHQYPDTCLKARDLCDVGTSEDNIFTEPQDVSKQRVIDKERSLAEPQFPEAVIARKANRLCTRVLRGFFRLRVRHLRACRKILIKPVTSEEMPNQALLESESPVGRILDGWPLIKGLYNGTRLRVRGFPNS